MHKKYNDTSNNSSDSSRKDDSPIINLNSPLEEKINEKINPNQSFHAPKLLIPKLDLTQAKKIQEYNAKRTTPQVNSNLDNKVIEKLQRYDIIFNILFL